MLYLLDSMSDNIQDEIINKFMDHEKKHDKHIANILSLKNELIEKKKYWRNEKTVLIKAWIIAFNIVTGGRILCGGG